MCFSNLVIPFGCWGGALLSLKYLLACAYLVTLLNVYQGAVRGNRIVNRLPGDSIAYAHNWFGGHIRLAGKHWFGQGAAFSMHSSVVEAASAQNDLHVRSQVVVEVPLTWWIEIILLIHRHLQIAWGTDSSVASAATRGQPPHSWRLITGPCSLFRLPHSVIHTKHVYIFAAATETNQQRKSLSKNRNQSLEDEGTVGSYRIMLVIPLVDFGVVLHEIDD